MSLRPNPRTDVRRNRYKVAIDAEEGRRRREDNMVEIRKSKREESLQKKRREGVKATQQFAASVPAAPAVDKKIDSIPSLVAGVFSDYPIPQLEATTQFQKLLSIGTKEGQGSQTDNYESTFSNHQIHQWSNIIGRKMLSPLHLHVSQLVQLMIALLLILFLLGKFSLFKQQICTLCIELGTLTTDMHIMLVLCTMFFTVLCACIVIGHLLEENRWANESIISLLLGLITRGIVLLVSKGSNSEILVFSEELFFIYLLPPIIFNAGFKVKKKQFFKNFSTILLFGVFGTLISFCLVSFDAFLLFKRIGWSLKCLHQKKTLHWKTLDRS